MVKARDSHKEATLLIVLSILSVVLMVANLSLKTNLEGNKILGTAVTELFADDFEREVALNPNWIVGDGTNPKNIVIDKNYRYSGANSIKVINNGTVTGEDGLQAVNHFFNTPIQGTVSVWVYDQGVVNVADDTAVSVSSKDMPDYLLMGMETGNPYYYYRTKQAKFNSRVKRTKGWHYFEFVATNYGTYGKIDNQNQANMGCADGINPADKCFDGVAWSLNNVYKLSLSRGHAVKGESYFDKVVANSLFSLPLTQQDIFDNWTNETYRIYGNTSPATYTATVDSLLDIDNPTPYNNVGSWCRAALAKAQMHLYYYEKYKKTIDLNVAKYSIDRVVYNHAKWGRRSLSSQIATQLGYTAWSIWPELLPTTKAEIYKVLTSEADYWSWIWGEVENKPRANTIQQSGYFTSLTPYVENIVVVTDREAMTVGATSPMSYTKDTKAEESGSNLQLLSTTDSMFGNNPTSSKWNYAANCFAFHTLTKDPGENFCNVNSRTINQSFQIGNHDIIPHLGYATAATTSLQQARFNYLLAKKSVPTMFYHNISNQSSSPIWVNNVDYCTDSNYMIKPSPICHRGLDWGDTSVRIIGLALPYWQVLDNDIKAKSTLDNLLSNNYFLYNGLITRPVANPIVSFMYDNQRGDAWINLERHAQVSYKRYVLDKYTDDAWRTSHFPINPKVCEDNIFKLKVWEGDAGLIKWDCSKTVTDGSGESAYIKSSNEVNVELYSPLMAVSPDTIYTLSYKVKTNNLIGSGALLGRMVVSQFNSNVKESSEVNENLTDGGMSYGSNVSGTKDWTDITYSFKTNSSAKYVRLRAFLGGEGTAKGEVWFDSPRLTVGGVITPTPSDSPRTYPITSCSATDNKYTKIDNWWTDNTGVTLPKNTIETYTTRFWKGNVQEVVYTKEDGVGYVWVRSGNGDDANTLKANSWIKNNLSNVWGVGGPPINGGITGAQYYLEGGKLKEVIVAGYYAYTRVANTVGEYDFSPNWTRTTIANYLTENIPANCSVKPDMTTSYAVRALNWNNSEMKFDELVGNGNILYLRQASGTDRAPVKNMCYQKYDYYDLWKNTNPPTFSPSILDYQIYSGMMREVVIEKGDFYYKDCVKK